MEISLLGILVALIVIGLVFWVVRYLAAAFGIPQPIIAVIYVILVVFVVIWLLSLVGVGPTIRIGR